MLKKSRKPVPPKRVWTAPTITRDSLLVGLGVLMMVHETLIAADPRESIILAAFGCMGSPLVMRGDEIRAKVTGRHASTPEPTTGDEE